MRTMLWSLREQHIKGNAWVRQLSVWDVFGADAELISGGCKSLESGGFQEWETLCIYLFHSKGRGELSFWNQSWEADAIEIDVFKVSKARTGFGA